MWVKWKSNVTPVLKYPNKEGGGEIKARTFLNWTLDEDERASRSGSISSHARARGNITMDDLIKESVWRLVTKRSMVHLGTDFRPSTSSPVT
jgi:hypothetical protein